MRNTYKYMKKVAESEGATLTLKVLCDSEAELRELLAARNYMESYKKYLYAKLRKEILGES